MTNEEKLSDAVSESIKAAESICKDLAPNSNDLLKKYQEEIEGEFKTSKEEVYKDALRSLIRQRDELIKQVDTIRTDLETLDKVKAGLDEAFLAGKLISREDAQKITKKIMKRIQEERDN